MGKIHYGGGPEGPSMEAIERAKRNLANGKFVSKDKLPRSVQKKKKSK